MKVQTTVNLPIEIKKQVRMVAAEMNTSMGNAAFELIKIGLAEYQKKIPGPSDPVYTMPVPHPVMEAHHG